MKINYIDPQKHNTENIIKLTLEGSQQIVIALLAQIESQNTIIEMADILDPEVVEEARWEKRKLTKLVYQLQESCQFTWTDLNNIEDNSLCL